MKFYSYVNGRSVEFSIQVLLPVRGTPSSFKEFNTPNSGRIVIAHGIIVGFDTKVESMLLYLQHINYVPRLKSSKETTSFSPLYTSKTSVLAAHHSNNLLRLPRFLTRRLLRAHLQLH